MNIKLEEVSQILAGMAHQVPAHSRAQQEYAKTEALVSCAKHTCGDELDALSQQAFEQCLRFCRAMRDANGGAPVHDKSHIV